MITTNMAQVMEGFGAILQAYPGLLRGMLRSGPEGQSATGLRSDIPTISRIRIFAENMRLLDNAPGLGCSLYFADRPASREAFRVMSLTLLSLISEPGLRELFSGGSYYSLHTTHFPLGAIQGGLALGGAEELKRCLIMAAPDGNLGITLENKAGFDWSDVFAIHTCGLVRHEGKMIERVGFSGIDVCSDFNAPDWLSDAEQFGVRLEFREMRKDHLYELPPSLEDSAVINLGRQLGDDLTEIFREDPDGHLKTGHLWPGQKRPAAGQFLVNQIQRF